MCSCHDFYLNCRPPALAGPLISCRDATESRRIIDLSHNVAHNMTMALRLCLTRSRA